MSWPVWEPATRCTGGPSSGAQAFMKWFLIEYGDKGGYNLGIYNCRTVRGGSTTSMHGEGRACDLGFPVGSIQGDRLLRRLLRVPGRLGIQCIIYERKIYSRKNPKGAPYTGVNPHRDHLHVEFTREAGEKLTYTTVNRVLAYVVNTPGSRDLRKGMKGRDVKWLQRRLDIPDDGIYGTQTVKAVRQFEASKKEQFPRLQVDGVVGRLTWRALGVKPTY